MTIKEKLIANRTSVAFILFLAILVSFSPTVFLGDEKWTIIPLCLLALPIFWLVYSSFVKNKLLRDGTITDANKDFIANFIWDFKPNSKIKIILQAYGMTIGIVIFLSVSISIIIPKSPVDVDIALSPLGPILFFGIFLACYFILKRRLK